jgi:branched-chain amino acid transport system permease protein
MLLLQLLVDGIQVGALYALMAVGFAIIFGSTKVFHYSHGAIFVFAGYCFLYCLQDLMWPWWVAALCTCAAVILLGIGMERFMYRPIQRDRGSFFTVFVASFGASIVIENVIAIAFGTGLMSVATPLSQAQPVIGSLSVSWLGVISIVMTLALFAALSWFFQKTDMGILLHALSESPELVSSFGFSRNRAAAFAFALGSVMVVPAAIVLICMTGIMPSSGHRVMLISLAATIIGGIGSLRGAGIGAFILGVAESLSFWKLPTGWGDAVSFVILLAFILLRPSGLLGLKVRV